MKTLELEAVELQDLVRRVFQPAEGERKLGILIDLPDDTVLDNDAWQDRRSLALEWARELAQASDVFLEPVLVAYRNAGANNADLPEMGQICSLDKVPSCSAELDSTNLQPMREILASLPFLLALTRFSATAPLKVAAKEIGFRGATMPGFQRSMIPALRLDWEEVERRVRLLAERLDRADSARIVFAHEGIESHLHLDLRFRKAHVSGGLVRQPGTAGNLPSGEAYIVPYEGEIEGEPSKTSGVLPVELEGEVVSYRFDHNRAVEVGNGGPIAEREAQRLREEPAYGNLAELGLGVLRELGVDPVGEVLLDEKLGLHLAFGRSEHFGGQVGPDDFSSKRAVIHIDRVYLPEIQPQISVVSCDLDYADGTEERILAADTYTIPWT